MRVVVGCILLGVVGCSSRGAPPTSETKSPAIEAIRAHPELAIHLAKAADPAAPLVENGLLSRALRVELPTRAHAPVRLSLAGKSDAWLTLTPRDVGGSSARAHGHARVFERARRSTDVVHVFAPGRYEETRVLHAADAPTSSSWSIGLGPDVARLRVRENMVEAVDRADRVLFVQHPPFAIDADGTRRDLVTELRDDTVTVTLDPTGLTYPIVIDPTWSVVAPTLTAHVSGGIALLPDGRVLLAGGRRAGITTGAANMTAEIYDPKTNTWTDAGTLPPTSVNGYAGALRVLPGGKALLFGNRFSPNPDTALWDGVKTWTAGPPLSGPRVGFNFETLADGRIVVVGGLDPSKPGVALHSNAEVYDPATNKWTTTGPHVSVGTGINPARLNDGRILIVGGQTYDASGTVTGALSSAEILDPATLKWTATTPMPEGRDGALLFVRPTGDVDVLQGSEYSAAGVPLLQLNRRRFHPSTATWDAPSPVSLSLTLLLLLSDGRALFPNSVNAIVHDPVADTFAFAGSAMTTIFSRAYVALADGRAMIVGGRDGSGTVMIPSTEADIWAQYALGAACTGDHECKSNHCTEGVCCTVATCGVGKTCAAAGAGGTCRTVDGYPCGASTECVSGSCADGVCCNRACTGQCEACDDPFALGTCKPVTGAPQGTRPACSDGGGNPCKATVCDGADTAACHLPAGGTVACGKNTCDAATRTELHVGVCDGAGTCVASSKSCGTFACGTTTCKTSCAVSADCAPGYWCDGGACVATLSLGKACSDASACDAKLACVDGVCCGSASCPAGGSCALPGKEGTCFLKLGAACTVGAECGSGECVDGVCCDGRCDGQCEACDAKGSEGTCAAIAGPPHGGRAACTADPSDPCKSSSCDGSTRTSCAGLAGSETTCRAQRCEGGTFTPAALCDGKGTCAETTSATCSGYTCADATACRTACQDDGDCVSGFRCESDKCVAVTSTCSDDGAQVIPTGGAPVACSPYVCRVGACLSACATSMDCSGGTVCSFATKTCVAPTDVSGGDDSTGGCSTGRARSSGGSLLVLFALGALLSRRRAQALLAASTIAAAGCSREQKEEPRASAAPILRVRASTPKLARFGLAHPAKKGLRAVLPERADAPLHLEDEDGAAIDVYDDDVRPASRTRTSDRARVHEGALVDTTILHAHLDDGAEEVRWLESARAKPTLRLRVVAGPKIVRLRVREGRIEALDASGRVRMGSAPMWAVDAKGTHRDLTLGEVSNEARTLVAEASLDVAGLAFPIAIDPAWTAAATMKYPRSSHATVLLADGRVLVAGGMADDVASASLAAKSAEIYDPATNAWSLTGPLAVGRAGAAIARFGTKVLVAGGFDMTSGLATADAALFDPATNAWTQTTPMPEPRMEPTGVTLPSGKVLVVGSREDSATPSTKSFVFDPATAKWAETTMLDPRSDAMTAQASDGSVLVFGGVSNVTYTDLSTAERFDPTTEKWTALAPMKAVRRRGGVVAFDSGKKLFVTGGTTGAVFGALSTSEIYDVAANTWKSGPSLPGPNEAPLVTLLSSGRVLVAGGTVYAMPSASWLVFDPTTSAFVSQGTMPIAADQTRMVTTSAGAFFAGGRGGPVGEVATRSTSYLFAPQNDGGACTSAAECKSGFCVEGVCCAVSACAAGSTCAGASSPGTCTKRDAVSCTTNAECASGFCVDGHCCESACTSQCAACDVPGNVGRCRPVKGAPRGARAACSATATECGPSCDGVDVAACHPRAAGTPCGVAACGAGKETHPSSCDGAGTCTDASKSCGAYACGATACNTSCASNADCAPGNACSGTTCVPLPGKGSDCSGTGACGPGLSCVSGVCCGTPSCPSDSVCPLGTGDCVKIDGAKCGADADCRHGHCVDGVCCNEACDGPCGACDVEGHEGKCVAVSGKPRGSRTCPSDTADPCGASSCNGADKSTCASKVGADVECRKQTCADGKATTSAFCQGTGVCPAPVVSECGSYRCNADGTACRARCTSAADCTTGSWCNEGKCEPLAGACSADGASIDVKGAGSVSCAPFVCRDNTCLTSCETSADCSGGNACDTVTKACVPPPTADDGGGCTMGSRAGSAGALMLLAAAAASARRRRAPPR